MASPKRNGPKMNAHPYVCKKLHFDNTFGSSCSEVLR